MPEGHLMPDHVEVPISIPPKYPGAQVAAAFSRMLFTGEGSALLKCAGARTRRSVARRLAALGPSDLEALARSLGRLRLSFDAPQDKGEEP